MTKKVKIENKLIDTNCRRYSFSGVDMKMCGRVSAMTCRLEN